MAFTLHTLLKYNAELYLYALLAGFKGTRTTHPERSQDRKTLIAASKVAAWQRLECSGKTVTSHIA